MSGRRLGFRLDAAGCIGCKACQVACQDAHDLAPGVRWRRVVAVEGGGWTQAAGGWKPDVKAFFVSIACFHCERPICVEVCPTRAMRKGEDGIVAVETDRCLGCGYCAWACPYGAPQLDEDRGVMTKCDLCRDRLAEGLDPSCVAACPMRVLTLAEVDVGAAAPSGFPLPPPALTRPVGRHALHPDAAGETPDLRIANEEEIS